MTAREPIKCNCQRQINSYHELKGLLEFFDFPVLLRSSDGKVICHNSHFLCLASRVGDISFSFQSSFSDEKYKKIISGEIMYLHFQDRF